VSALFSMGYFAWLDIVFYFFFFFFFKMDGGMNVYVFEMS
jgi:hypothetical protein